MALLGSGEFLPGTAGLDRRLLEGRPRRVVHLPTAAAPDGPERLEEWVELGRAHFEALGCEYVPLPVVDRTGACEPALAAAVAGAGLVYLSGGNPGFLADTLRDSAVLAALITAWRDGTALAGCSAGAMALTAWAEDVRRRLVRPGLGLVPELSVIPHYGHHERFWPGFERRRLARLAPGQDLVGIEEDTAIVRMSSTWQVTGAGLAWRWQGERWTQLNLEQ